MRHLSKTKNPVRILLVAATVLVALPALADEPAPRTIRVTGEATVKAAPDRCRVSVSVTSRAASAKEASEANARASKAVLDRLKAAVAPPGEVRTAGYDLTAEYDYNQPRAGNRGPALVGYVATNRFAITTADLEGVGALLDAAVASGANQVDSISFFLADEKGARREALLQAGQNAKAEAETVAQGVGVALGEVLDASSTSAPTPVPVYGRAKAAMAMDMAQPETQVVPGSLEVNASVSVTYAIR